MMPLICRICAGKNVLGRLILTSDNIKPEVNKAFRDEFQQLAIYEVAGMGIYPLFLCCHLPATTVDYNLQSHHVCHM